MPTMPSLQELLKAGVHFGHQTGKWHPKMEPYLFAERNGIHVIDLEKTQARLQVALEFITRTVANGGNVLFVSTKPQAKDIIAKYAAECGMPYVSRRWLGGTLTNFGVIGKMIKKYKDLKSKQETNSLRGYTKREQLEFSKDIAKFEERSGGIAELKRVPSALFVIDIMHEKTAVAEAISKKIPIVAVCDSNVNPSKVSYVIPGNDDAAKGIELFVRLAAEAAAEGKKIAEQQAVNTAAVR